MQPKLKDTERYQEGLAMMLLSEQWIAEAKGEDDLAAAIALHTEAYVYGLQLPSSL